MKSIAKEFVFFLPNTLWWSYQAGWEGWDTYERDEKCIQNYG